jgi:hypothetical protein
MGVCRAMSDPTKPALTIVPRPALTTVPRRTHTTLTVGFGPPRSRFFDRALAHVRAAELTEIRPGRFEARFTLRVDPAAFAHVGALCRLIRHWRGTTVEEDGLPVPATVVRDMGFCAADQLVRHGECRVPFSGPVPARCGPCPLFDPARLSLEASRAQGRHPAGRVLGRGSRLSGARRPRLRVVREGEPGRAPQTTFTVVVGPSRSRDAQRALARAKAGASRLTEGPDGSWRAEFEPGEDPSASLAFQATLRLLVMVRGTEVWMEGLPVSPGQALGRVSRMRPTYVVPPPRDLVSLLVDDLLTRTERPTTGRWRRGQINGPSTDSWN